jgi:hypothetical protein
MPKITPNAVITHNWDRKLHQPVVGIVCSTFHPGDGAMLNMGLSEFLAKLSVAEFQAEIREFTGPLVAIFPDKRLCEVECMSIQNILATETPVIAAMSRSASQMEADCWAIAKRCIDFWKTSVSIIIICTKGCIGLRRKPCRKRDRIVLSLRLTQSISRSPFICM